MYSYFKNHSYVILVTWALCCVLLSTNVYATKDKNGLHQNDSSFVDPKTPGLKDEVKAPVLAVSTEDFKRITGKTLVGEAMKPRPLQLASEFDLELGFPLQKKREQSSGSSSIRIYNKINESVGFLVTQIHDSAHESHVYDSIKKAQTKGRGSVIVGNGRTKHFYKDGERRSFIVVKAPDGLAKALAEDDSTAARRTALVSLPTDSFVESFKMSHCNIYSPEASIEIDRLGKYIYCRCKKNEIDGKLVCED